MIYQDIYNCICQIQNKRRYTIQYVKPTTQLVFKNRFPKGGPTCRMQVVNPRHQTSQGQSVAKPETPLQNIQVENQQDITECLLMLMNIIHKGSMSDSSSTTSPTGASLSDILFSFVLEKYIVCNACGLKSPSFESSSVLFSPTDTSSMQNLILEGLQQKLQKSCSRCNKNNWHVESSYILQPPKWDCRTPNT